MDKLFVDPSGDTRECVSCGYSDARPRQGSPAADLPTRVSRPAARRVETAAEVITIVPAHIPADPGSDPLKS